MSKVKIINLKAGACVVNSLKQIIPGMSFVIKDSSVMDDPDLIELQSLGIISVQELNDVVLADKPVNQDSKKSANVSPKKETKGKKNGSGKISKESGAKQVKVAANKPGTDFRSVDNVQEDIMGGKVVIIGDNGPEFKRMNPGINGATGPKYVGDAYGDEPTNEDGFLTV